MSQPPPLRRGATKQDEMGESRRGSFAGADEISEAVCRQMSLVIIGKKRQKKKKGRQQGEKERKRGGCVGARKYRPLQLRHELTGARGKPKAGEGLTLTHQGTDARSRVLPAPQGAPHLQEPRPAVAGAPLCFSSPAFFSLLPPGSCPPLTFCRLTWSLPSAPSHCLPLFRGYRFFSLHIY